jgi:FeS assembly protein IscX
MDTFGWTDIEDIALALVEAHPDVDPTTVRFDRLREMVEELEDFEPEPGQTVNEQILEAIQAAWIEEAEDAAAGLPAPGDEDVEEDDDEGGYTPNQPFR